MLKNGSKQLSRFIHMLLQQKNTFFNLVSINIYANATHYSKFHFPGPAIIVVPVRWMSDEKCQSN